LLLIESGGTGVFIDEMAIEATKSLNERDHERFDRTRYGGCVNPALKAIIGHGEIRPKLEQPHSGCVSHPRDQNYHLCFGFPLARGRMKSFQRSPSICPLNDSLFGGFSALTINASAGKLIFHSESISAPWKTHSLVEIAAWSCVSMTLPRASQTRITARCNRLQDFSKPIAFSLL
jgi:hypothetical protein